MNIDEHLSKTMKSIKYDESPQMTRSHPESSKGFHRGNKSFLKALRNPYTEIDENPS